MATITQSITAPPGSGTEVRGKTLTQILVEACERHENDYALNHPRGNGWHTWSLDRFREESEEIAAGLLEIGVRQGDHVAMYMESDVLFCLVDMACLMMKAVDVPIYLTHKKEQTEYVIQHSESRALVVSDAGKLDQIRSIVERCDALEYVIVAESAGPVDAVPGKRTMTLDDLRAEGRRRRTKAPDEVRSIMDSIQPDDTATIIYTSGTTGEPKGVILSHENISFDALTSFTGLHDYRPGRGGEVALSFLPLTHIFARALHYGFLYTGTSVYFTTPDDLTRDLKRVRPTVFASVPRLIEKVYGRILQRAHEATGVQKRIMDWSLALAKEYEIGREPNRWWKIQHAVVDRLVFSKWRDALGGRVRYIIAGGAALNASLANIFAAAGVMVLQGYGLTETSPVITFNRPDRNRAGTVGVPIPGVEVAVSDEGEVLTRGPHVMKGYFKNDERTRQVITEDGWLRTGDVGEITDEGYLRITDRLKDLFKLSTGKYVTPAPLESELATHPLIEQAVVVGAGYKYCTALIFPAEDAVRVLARRRGLDSEAPIESLIQAPAVRRRYQQLVDDANRMVDHWSEIKRFVIVPAHLTVENGLLTPTMKVRRPQVRERFEKEIRTLYEEEPSSHSSAESALVND